MLQNTNACWAALIRSVGTHIQCIVGPNRINTPYMTVYLVIPLPTIPYIHCIYMVLANPKLVLQNTNACWAALIRLVGTHYIQCVPVPMHSI